MDNLGMVAYIENGFAYINFQRKSSCGDNCASCSGNCKANNHLVKVQNNLNAKKGDLVQLDLSTSDFLKMSFLLYMTPLIVLVTSIIALDYFIDNSPASIIIGIALTALTFVLVDKYVKSKNKKGQLIVKMEKLIETCEEQNILE